MSIRFEKGDLFAVECDALAHGVNTKGVMGGIAGAFQKNFPLVSAVYQEKCDADYFIPGDNYMGYENGKYILHVVSQDEPGPDAKRDWLYLGLIGAVNALVVERMFDGEENKATIAMPLIGCGIGGLDFTDFYNVIGWVNAIYRDWVEIVVVYNDQNEHLIPKEVLASYEDALAS